MKAEKSLPCCAPCKLLGTEAVGDTRDNCYLKPPSILLPGSRWGWGQTQRERDCVSERGRDKYRHTQPGKETQSQRGLRSHTA